MAPAEDANQNIYATFVEVPGTDTTVVQIKRKLDTGYANDYVIGLDIENPISWAVNVDTFNINSKHTNVGEYVKMTLPSEGGAGSLKYPDSAASFSVIMGAATALLASAIF